MRICVFCGSNTGRGETYMSAAFELGKMIAELGYGLVYGGARDGTMGATANGAMSVGGEAIGVLPRQLFELEQAHPALTKLHVVDSMHERKQVMHDLSDAFICMPGGIGTMEETFEVWTWTQLGVHSKPLAFYNVNGFYNALEKFFDVMVTEGFVRPVHRQMALTGDEPKRLIEELMSYEPPKVKKWLLPEER